MEAADFAVAIAQDDDGGGADGEGEGGPGLGEFHVEADQDPFAPEDGLNIEGEDVGVVVERLGKGVAGAAGVEQLADASGVVHRILSGHAHRLHAR